MWFDKRSFRSTAGGGGWPVKIQFSITVHEPGRGGGRKGQYVQWTLVYLRLIEKKRFSYFCPSPPAAARGTACCGPDVSIMFVQWTGRVDYMPLVLQYNSFRLTEAASSSSHCGCNYCLFLRIGIYTCVYTCTFFRPFSPSFFSNVE